MTTDRTRTTASSVNCFTIHLVGKKFSKRKDNRRDPGAGRLTNSPQRSRKKINYTAGFEGPQPNITTPGRAASLATSVTLFCSIPLGVDASEPPTPAPAETAPASLGSKHPQVLPREPPVVRCRWP